MSLMLSNTYQENEFWALTSTVAGNGYAGLTIIPRWGKFISDLNDIKPSNLISHYDILQL